MPSKPSKANSPRIEQQLDETREEQSGEEGLLAEVIEGEGEKQKITAKAVKARLKEIGNDPDYADERQALEDYAALLDQQADAKARLKAAQEDLEAKLDAKYPKLTEDEIKTLVVDDKWLATLAAAVQGELDRVSQTLTGRIRQLAERYATPLPQLTDEVATLAGPRGRTPQEDGGGMEVKPGYKQTEVGVIPEEWETHPCSDLSERIMVGIVIRPTQYYVGLGVPAFRSANIREDGINTSNLVFISDASNALLVKSQTQTGDVLTVRTGYPGTSAVVRPATPRYRTQRSALFIASDT